MRFLLPCRLLLGAAIGPKGGTLRHYEVVAIIHPDQHERAEAMAERYKKIVTGGGGVLCIALRIGGAEIWPISYRIKNRRNIY